VRAASTNTFCEPEHGNTVSGISVGVTDEVGMIAIAQERGWNPADTKAALDGWVQRMGQSMAVGQQFRKFLGC